MMREVGALEARNTLPSLLDLVEKGEQVAITRRGKRVARLVPDLASHDRNVAREAAEAILQKSKGATLAGLRVKDLIDKGRP